MAPAGFGAVVEAADMAGAGATTAARGTVKTEDVRSHLAGSSGGVVHSSMVVHLYDDLVFEVFDAHWEARQGAAAALFAVLQSVVGRGSRGPSSAAAGSDGGGTAAAMRLSEQPILVDCACRSLCLLALDRFGDFSSGASVAPVREVVAQIVGFCAAHLPVSTVAVLVPQVLVLCRQQLWHIRHGGFVAMHHILSVLSRHALPQADSSRCSSWGREVVEVAACAVAEDDSEDVRRLACRVLTTIIANHAAFTALEVLPLQQVVDASWQRLQGLDDLSVDAGATLQLYSTALTHFEETATGSSTAERREQLQQSLLVCVTRFMHHSEVSVRRETFVAVKELLARTIAASNGSTAAIPPDLAIAAAHALLCSIAFDTVADIRSASLELLQQIVVAALHAPLPPTAIAESSSAQAAKRQRVEPAAPETAAVEPLLSFDKLLQLFWRWFELLFQPSGTLPEVASIEATLSIEASPMESLQGGVPVTFAWRCSMSQSLAKLLAQCMSISVAQAGTGRTALCTFFAATLDALRADAISVATATSIALLLKYLHEYPPSWEEKASVVGPLSGCVSQLIALISNPPVPLAILELQPHYAALAIAIKDCCDAMSTAGWRGHFSDIVSAGWRVPEGSTVAWAKHCRSLGIDALPSVDVASHFAAVEAKEWLHRAATLSSTSLGLVQYSMDQLHQKCRRAGDAAVKAQV